MTPKIREAHHQEILAELMAVRKTWANPSVCVFGMSCRDTGLFVYICVNFVSLHKDVTLNSFNFLKLYIMVSYRIVIVI